MCGRYVQTMPADAMRELFRTAGALPNLAPSWNVAPTDPVYAVLERSGRRVQLTPQGELLVEGAGRLLDEMERLESALGASLAATEGEPLRGTVRLAVFQSAALGIVPRALAVSLIAPSHPFALPRSSPSRPRRHARPRRRSVPRPSRSERP